MEANPSIFLWRELPTGLEHILIRDIEDRGAYPADGDCDE